ncbi:MULTISPECIES: protein translocase subunit SecD [unclassified Agarivorans]|uniref:protein translocase subunit SecD n=1 Tax=unclassified Agarivorans TaxID=2636026 RepID=UPI0010F6F5BD|nr:MULTISPECIES: protein translocase subunit SecD [unclassified Agarivorans]MDO6687313.1 protein translocase subunit SecD [Agarivorans sp. 3_MG-2023]MDO6716971.1 protein translocase subunit SecD [Agarivorans sp. 2_MG-2023]MDO6765083.1 protein translocase subunit SecD [Agarivorans sp. 1_MG-2023]
MLNRYPWWKNVMVVALIAIGFLYAMPNLYGEDPAVQVSGTRGAQVELAQLDNIRNHLTAQSIDFRSVGFEDGLALVRLRNDADQLKVKSLLHDLLGDDYIVALNLAPATPGWLDAIGAAPLKLGLDLRGGVHFLMEVDMDAAISKAQEGMIQDFRSDLREEKLRYAGVRAQGDAVVVRFRDEATLDKAISFLDRKYNEYQFSDASQGDQFRLSAKMTEAKLKETRDYALQQNITIIRNRVNELGVAEPQVQRQGSERIVVQLPGVQDTARAKEILGATATLEFRMVNTDADLRDAAAGRVPPGSQLAKRVDGSPVVLRNQVILTGDHIVGAQSGFDEYSRPQVNISLDSQGGSKMAGFTKDNVGQSMATLFIEYKPTGEKDAEGKSILQRQEEVINVATIQSRLGRSFRITGIDSPSEAQNLALLLRAGALIAPIQIVEERTVGPSLGQDNIDKGFMAIVMGLLALLVFMPLYYRKFGLVADLALVANVGVIIGFMSMIPGATLTLPGMAGIVLTVGMAVDANVLIFERIREELKDGRSPQQAIHHGYSNALSTISDANITTFITALILFAIGTGAVKGFAVTLAIGIATSMFTAIVGTRVVVNLVWGGKKIDKLSI